MAGILLQALFCTVGVAVGYIITNPFRKEKIVFNKTYLLKASFLFVFSVIAVLAYDLLVGKL